MAPHMGGKKTVVIFRQWYTDPILQGSDHMYYNLPNFKRIFHLPGSIFSFRVNFLRVHCLPNKLLWISINWKRFLQTRTSWLVKCQLATDFPVVLGSSHIEPGASWVITVWKMMSGCIYWRRNPKEKLRFFWDFPSWAKASCVKRSTEKGRGYSFGFSKKDTPKSRERTNHFESESQETHWNESSPKKKNHHNHFGRVSFRIPSPSPSPFLKSLQNRETCAAMFNPCGAGAGNWRICWSTVARFSSIKRRRSGLYN